MTVLAEGIDIHKDAEFEALHPRDDDGRFRNRILGAVSWLAEQFGEVVNHFEFGEPDSFEESHGVATLHADGSITVATVDDEDERGILMRPGEDFPWPDFLDSLSNAAEDASEDDFDISTPMEYDFTPDYGESLSITFGGYADGSRFVGVDTDEVGVGFTPGGAMSLVQSLEGLTEARQARMSGDPTLTYSLPAGETLTRRKVFTDRMRDYEAVAGLVDTPQGARVRLGVISSSEGEADKWTGGRGKTTLDLDRDLAGQVAAVLEELNAAGRERQKRYDEYQDRFGELDEQDADQSEYDELDQEIVDELGGSFEDDFETRVIDTPWGTLRLTDVGMDDEANAHDRHIRMEVWPSGMSEAEYDAGQSPAGGPAWAWPGAAERYEKPDADLRVKDIRALIKLLRESFTVSGAPTEKSAGGTARRAGNQRIAREGRKYWTRTPEGLGKWARKAHPWTALYRHLVTKMNPELARRLTSSYFKAVFGYAPSMRQGKNPVGRG